MIRIIFLVLFFAVSSQAQFYSSLQKPFDLNQLVQLVNQKQVTTLDQLVPHLPKRMLQNPVLFYDSRALKRHLVTPDSPRIVLFNEDSSLIIALTKNPGDHYVQAGEDTLEILSFNKQTKKFDMINVPFDGKPQPFERLAQHNPMICLRCHGPNPRPIFHDYNGWPGVYGSFSQKGFAMSGTKEHGFLNSFLNQYKNQERYKHLDLSEVRSSIKGISIPSTGISMLYDEKDFTPSLALGAQIEYLMYQRLAQKLEQNVDFANFINLIAAIGTANHCTGNEIAHRWMIKDLYRGWIESQPQSKQSGEQVAEKIYRQVKTDFDRKNVLFSAYNIADKSVDSRGLMNLPYETFYIGSTPWAKVDKDAFAAQFVILESLAQYLGLSNDDFSTVQGYPTLGIFHIRKLSLYPDEQIFMAIAEGFILNQSRLAQKFISPDCANVKRLALAELKKLPMAVPKFRGIFYR